MSTAKSNSAAWVRLSALLAILLSSALLVGWSRPRLLASLQKVRAGGDVYALPSPEQTVALSLGYRSALADWLFAGVLVSSGIHVQEKRRFEFLGEYIDVVNALDPNFRSPYRFADTLLVLQSVPAREREYRKARQILLRGLEVFPHDGELWMNAGQYLAYLAAPHLEDPKEQDAWRLEGAKILARACELVGAASVAEHSCLSAAGMLNKAGERDATIGFLERFLSLSDDPELRKKAGLYLDHLNAERQRERMEQRSRRFNDLWRKHLPFVKRETVLLLGPPFDSARCAGRVEDQDCATSWREFNATLTE